MCNYGRFGNSMIIFMLIGFNMSLTIPRVRGGAGTSLTKGEIAHPFFKGLKFRLFYLLGFLYVHDCYLVGFHIKTGGQLCKRPPK